MQSQDSENVKFWAKKFQHLTAVDLQLHPADCPVSTRVKQDITASQTWISFEILRVSEMKINDVYDSLKLNITWCHIINYFMELEKKC